MHPKVRGKYRVSWMALPGLVICLGFGHVYISCKNVSYRKYMTCALLSQNQHFCSFNLGGGGRAGKRNGGATIINTNANTNTNTGATVNINSTSPEAPSSAAAAQRQASCNPLGSFCKNASGQKDDSICCSKHCVSKYSLFTRQSEFTCTSLQAKRIRK